MPAFDETQQALRGAWETRDAAQAALAAARERIARIDARIGAVERRNTGDPDMGELVGLKADRAMAEAQAEHQTGLLTAAQIDVGLRSADFAVFTDPRERIDQFSAATPILMMPVRLETRFKGDELWVRVFPDDCLIDVFDPVLSETEVTNARAYWIAMWQAGGVADQDAAAWMALVQAQGSGRAGWIADHYQPTNLATKPVKADPKDIVLTVASATPLSAAEEPPVAVFWKAMWLADGDAQQSADARTALEAALGAARSANIAQNYPPANFAAPLPSGLTKAAATLSLAFLYWPAVETKEAAWSQAPKARLLPDRFVFLGYEKSVADEPLVILGNPVPSPLVTGPDPAAPATEQLQHDANGDLMFPDELRWLRDFDRAVAIGMGFRIKLTQTQARHGFVRVLVLGLRLSADAQAGRGELESLLTAHASSRSGLSVIPLGTPTNNSEASPSGASRRDDPAASAEDRKQPLFTPTTDWLAKADGQWLAEYLGIDPTLFLNVHGAGGKDQASARAMNAALWPATLGYWMDERMHPVFSDAVVGQTRDFFTRFVVGGGACPSIRIGMQPYGILPATAFSRMSWLTPRGGPQIGARTVKPFLYELYRLIGAVDKDVGALVGEVAFVGKSGVDPHAALLDIIGLHPGSVEWSQRYAESLKSFFNRANLQGFSGFIEALIVALQRGVATDKLHALGYAGEALPPILDLIFNGKHNLLKGGVVEDAPLSEADPLGAATTDARNYLQWLIDAANTSLDAVYKQEGFANNKVPTSLLYLYLRHALQLGYSDTSMRLYLDAGLYDPAAAARAKLDSPFLHISQAATLSESRYQPLYASAPAITGSATQLVHEFIGQRLALLPSATGLKDQVEALEHLRDRPTAQLERAFADHIDCCSYRLDAWLLGLVTYQLCLMRDLTDGGNTQAQPGVYLGAFSWLENLAPQGKQLTPVRLTDPDLAATFDQRGEPPLMRDSTNQGYVHAPSLNHAVAAAVLRNGYISNASSANPQTLAVNLTSERVRIALSMIEGVRAGQSLSDLIGYQIERGLHDGHGGAEVDQYIYTLRKAFPLRADRLQSTKTDEDVPIEAIEARNVVNGLALIEQVTKSGVKTYPFGRADLPAIADPAARNAIDVEVDRALETHDAVADLALSEGVYQAVLGNYDRVASTYDAYARGHFPPEPDVCRTPIGGIGLTHRVALHLDAAASHTASPVAGVAMTPRAQGEPALNAWLAAVLPPLGEIACLVDFREAASGAEQTREVKLEDLALQPADVIRLLRDDHDQTMTELDDRVVRYAVDTFDPRPDRPVSIRYMATQTAALSVFELMPLARHVQRIVATSRPLVATDASLSNEALTAQDAVRTIDQTRLDAVVAALTALQTDLTGFKAALDPLLADIANRRGDMLSGVDGTIDDLATLLARATLFALPQAGWGFAYDARARGFAAVVENCSALVARWTVNLAACDASLTAAGAAATDVEKLRLLAAAERAISTGITVETDPPTLAAAVGAKRTAFSAKLDSFTAIVATTRAKISDLLADVHALLPVIDEDFAPFALDDVETALLRFAEDADRVVTVMLVEIDRRLTLASQQFAVADAAAAAADKVSAQQTAARALLGEDFGVYPVFHYAAAPDGELANALGASASGALLAYLTAPPEPERTPLDFPVDTWLSGIARVREKMFSLEQVIMFAEALGGAEPALTPLQFPYAADDRWLALEFPPDLKLDRDRLLYTAQFAIPPVPGAAHCGLLIDEWTETIPTTTIDTAAALHHDRPNNEAPQTMLLVTPTSLTGAWRWADLVDALNETLDLAKRRAVEPSQIDSTPYAPFLPATTIATQARQLTIALDLAFNNNIALLAKDA